MYEPATFSGQTGDSLLHVWDARCKLAALAITGGATFGAAPAALAALSLIPAAGAAFLGLALWRIARDLKIFFLFLFFLVAAHALFTPGEELIRLGWIGVSRPGLAHGLVLAWRLFLVTACGVLFAATTPNSRIRASVEWFLKPLPGVPHGRIASMMGLLLGLLPGILASSNAVSCAQQARGADQVKNPVRRLRLFATALLRTVFSRSQNLALAMTARCYSDTRTPQEFKASAKDMAVLAGVAAFVAFIRFNA
ncbi:MAG: energy-coupling factor transporter transmembrane component T [Desulfatibacillaceae bacterium]|nr:energy-coupling factor transporter transmembrane component T [Desulfatibacillaceae bacterium]